MTEPLTPGSYLRPASPAEAELEINRSRFICYLQPVNGREEADRFIQSIRDRHPKANHNCWSYIAGAPNDAHQWNFSDDGEPKGTAGQPMLNILRHSDLGQICAVVTRYFGGIKLGTGGLVRAYGQSVQAALEVLETETVVPVTRIILSAPYEQTGVLEQLINQCSLSRCERIYESLLQIHAEIETHRLQQLRDAMEPWQHLISLETPED